ncbi:molybdenum cofactor guanylyltransferase [Pacificimonas flava]|uniref:Molybdopterin-guanine dinucleotide biosynthesis protein MobA n=1 Tax=Pacificimonas flava TaxID=1234595 RepID=M2U777_9SPHN|nr:molybdenum cofactor guanylyltransferase [Pacificimonas flava]EMD83838.1 Molybdopterin-guanine dinucleotide biosynthesis protein MobA [Pacificimonas flava]MBB5281184.1 molybdopterin-guanine dinucleotide biosynthesis protein A [Pacificimonas flava]
MRILGALIAGGRSRRFGSDKALADWNGKSLVSHAAEALAQQCEDVVVCGGCLAGFRSLEDRPRAGLGPLGGLNAALHLADRTGLRGALCVPVDVHPLPFDLRGNLVGTAPCVLREQRTVGWWPASLAAQLDEHLAAGHRSFLSWIEATDAQMLDDSAFALINVNRPHDMAALRRRR